jgi:hypothetical protein
MRRTERRTITKKETGVITLASAILRHLIGVTEPAFISKQAKDM